MMYSSKSAGTRFDCWNQESWNHSTIEDWNHYHHSHHHSHHHNSSSHYHHHHHHHLHHLQHHVQQNSSSSNISPHSAHSHSHSHSHAHLTPLSLSNHSSTSNDTLPRQIHFTGESYSYNNSQTASSLDETFSPSRIEYCDQYPPVGNLQYPSEYSYYEPPEPCSYSPRQWPPNSQHSAPLSSSSHQASPSGSFSHQPQIHASFPHSSHSSHPSPLHRAPPPQAAHDLLSYHHRYDTQSVTNFTNNSISVNVSVNALNIPTLPVPGGDPGTQANAVAGTIQYKIETQLEKRITITPAIKPLTPAGQLPANGKSSGPCLDQSPIGLRHRKNSPKSLYSTLKHYRIPKKISLRSECHRDLQCESQNSVQNQNICYICGKNYARPSTLKTHLRTHSGEKPYRCNSCGKAFTQAANLTAHIRTHSGEKPFPCPICKRRFSQSSSVTTHLRIHSGERPYLCNYCRKSFSDSSTLTKHLRIHSGEKPYQCRMCTLKFSQSGNLNRHMRVHS